MFVLLCVTQNALRTFCGQHENFFFYSESALCFLRKLKFEVVFLLDKSDRPRAVKMGQPKSSNKTQGLGRKIGARIFSGLFSPARKSL